MASVLFKGKTTFNLPNGFYVLWFLRELLEEPSISLRTKVTKLLFGNFNLHIIFLDHRYIAWFGLDYG